METKPPSDVTKNVPDINVLAADLSRLAEQVAKFGMLLAKVAEAQAFLTNALNETLQNQAVIFARLQNSSVDTGMPEFGGKTGDDKPN